MDYAFLNSPDVWTIAEHETHGLVKRAAGGVVREADVGVRIGQDDLVGAGAKVTDLYLGEGRRDRLGRVQIAAVLACLHGDTEETAAVGAVEVAGPVPTRGQMVNKLIL